MTLYTCDAVRELIDRYTEKNGHIITIQEGTLGYGILLMVAKGYKTTVVTEVYLNEWSSAHKIRMYNRTPEKYKRFLNNVIFEQ